MRLQNYITELSFEKSTELNVTHDSSAGYYVEFNIDDIYYLFRAQASGDKGYDKWDISFLPRYDAKVPKDKSTVKHATRVFSAVGQSLKQFIKKKKPFAFHFSGQSNVLERLYDKFIPMIAKQLKGYKYNKSFSDMTGRHYFEKK